MLKKLSKILVVIGLVALPLAVASPAYADDTDPTLGGSSGGTSDPISGIQDGVKKIGGTKTGTDDFTGKVKLVVNTLLFLLGAIAVVMLILGGIKYTTSNGDANQIKSAKDTILYAVIGIIVALMAYAIVNFVIGALNK